MLNIKKLLLIPICAIGFVCGGIFSVFADTACANLPSGYTQVEYIESTGTQYIDARQNFLFGDEFYFDYMKMSNSVSTENKGYGSGSTYALSGGGRIINGIIQIYVSGNAAYTPSLSAADALQKRYIENWEITSGKLNSTLTEVGTSNVYTLTANSQYLTSSYTTGDSVYLFRDHNSNYAHPSAMRVYLTWLKRSNGNYAFYLIPAKRNSDNAIGMYDTVSGTFLTNSGSGTFSAGSVVPCNTTITLTFDGVSTTPSQCTYGGTFVPPTPAPRTGYVFAGWKVKTVNP